VKPARAIGSDSRLVPGAWSITRPYVPRTLEMLVLICKTRFGVSLKTVKALRTTIPESILLRADEVIR
jgi:hypothetical protein